MVKDVLFYFVLPIVALVICSLCGMVGLVIALILTLCVQIYTFRQSIKNKKQIEKISQDQREFDDSFNVRRKDGKVTVDIIAGDY